MKEFNFFVKAVLALGLLFAVSCSKDESKKTVPDPPGTMTANLGSGWLNFTGWFSINWTTPDNFYLHCGNYSNMYGMSICDLGSMSGLGNITEIPAFGFTAPNCQNMAVACEKGHGYVIKCISYSRGEIVDMYYVRLYVIEPIVSTSGGIMGAKVKYQYPFEP